MVHISDQVRRKPLRFLLPFFLTGVLWQIEPGAALADAGASSRIVGVDVCTECHKAQQQAMHHSKHGQVIDERSPFADKGCETCHGPGEKHAFSEGKERGELVVFGQESGVDHQVQNEKCLACHTDTNLMHWQGSAHEMADLSCTGCHKMHEPDLVLTKSDEVEICVSCHVKQRSEILRASTHPLWAGKMNCTSCHGSHGGDGPKELTALTINENCYECHAEMRGPFLWEHEPTAENCDICHTPHGSNNPALLLRRPPQLCQMCHQSIAGGAEGLSHIRRYYDFSLTEESPGPSGSSGPARFILGMSCANCHSQVHGTNHPSGWALQR